MSRPIARRLKGEIAPGYRLRRPLKVSIVPQTTTHSSALAACPRGLGTFGLGVTTDAAMADLGEMVVDLYHSLEGWALEPGFGDNLPEQLHWLRRNLIREGG